jgi:hypothetical protein
MLQECDRMTPEKTGSEFDPQEWARRLEAGLTDDPELVLAHRLASNPPAPARPTPGFRSDLRHRLLETYPMPAQRSIPFKRLIPFFAAALILAIVLIIAWPRGVQGVSASEILHAATIGASALGTGDVTYDRFRLDWDMGNTRVENVTGEMWYSAGSQLYRYQLTSSTGELLFYQAYDGEYTTQSIHNQPVGEGAVSQVYRFKGFVPLWIERPGSGGLLANPSPVNFWVLAVHQAQQRNSGCTDLFCLLGLSQEGWDCAGSRCKYSLGNVGGMGNMGFELALRGVTRLEDGRQVYEIRLLPGGVLSQYVGGFGTVYVNVGTKQIVKVVYSMKMIFRAASMGMSLEHLERSGLESASLPADFFRTPPKDIPVIPWAGDLQRFINSHYGGQDNRVWVISSDPPSGTRISGKVTFNLELGYQLTGLPYANLGVKLWGIGKDTATNGKRVPVQAGEGVVHVSLTVDTDQLAEGAWAAGADLGTYIDAGPGFAINDLPLFDTQWCVRCEPALLPTQPVVIGTYWRLQIQVSTVGQVADGYRVSQVSISPTHLLLHRSGLVPQTALPQTVETEPVDLSGLSETTVIPVRLILPEDAERIGPATVEVTVEVVRK